MIALHCDDTTRGYRKMLILRYRATPAYTKRRMRAMRAARFLSVDVDFTHTRTMMAIRAPLALAISFDMPMCRDARSACWRRRPLCPIRARAIIARDARYRDT